MHPPFRETSFHFSDVFLGPKLVRFGSDDSVPSHDHMSSSNNIHPQRSIFLLLAGVVAILGLLLTAYMEQSRYCLTMHQGSMSCRLGRLFDWQQEDCQAVALPPDMEIVVRNLMLEMINSRLLDFFSTSLEERDAVVLSPSLEAVIRGLVHDTMNSHSTNTHGFHDFARKANGGRIALPITSGYHGVLKWFVPAHGNDPNIVIDDQAYAETCWVVQTLPAQVGIRTSEVIYPTHITVENLVTSTADSGRAPKNIRLWGVVDGKLNQNLFKGLSPPLEYPSFLPAFANDFLWAPLASFVYDPNIGGSRQLFPIAEEYRNSGLSFGVFVVEVLDNWGSASTCVSKIMIHGIPV